MVEIKDPSRPLSANDIAELEAFVGCKLPADYRAFLLRTNGGTPEPDVIDIEGAPFQGSVVRVLHGIDTSDKCDDIRWNLQVLEGCLENKLLPIATDPYGHKFMLVLNEDHYGHVNYFDSGEIPPRPYLVTDNFDEFLAKLRAYTPEELADIDAMSSGSESETVEPVDISFQFTGSRPADAALGNAAAGYETTPRGYVWHRHQDGRTLQLVPKDVHKQTGDPAGYALRWRPS